MKRGIAEVPGYRSEETVEPKGKLPELSVSPESTRRVNIFLSYAHEDEYTKGAFYEIIRKRLKTTSSGIYFTFSSDNDILVGENWHEKIQEMIVNCDYGLLLLSTSFLASKYITNHELSMLMDKCLPVALHILDLERQDMKGLKKNQIFFRNNQSFSEVKGNNRIRFINELAVKIEERVKKTIDTRKAQTKNSGPPADDSSILTRFKGYEGYDYNIHSKAKIREGIIYPISYKPNYAGISDNVNALNYIKSWVYESEVPFFVLLGDYGTGKTLTCRMLARAINEFHDREPDNYPLCIYIDLRMVATRVGTGNKIPRITDVLQDFIENKRDPLDRSQLTPEDIIRRVRGNRAMVIFDGLDEKTVHFSPDETIRFVAEILKVREVQDKKGQDKQGKVLFSCRTHYFKDVIEQNSLLLGRDREEEREAADYLSCTLLKFDESQIKDYLKKRLKCSNKNIDRIFRLFEQVHNLKDLAMRPYALSLITTEFIPDLEQFAHKGKIINTARLYGITIEKWLRRDEGKHEFIAPHKKRIMKFLAAEIHNRSGESMKTDELDEWLDEWLAAHPAISDAYRGQTPRETLKKDLRTATFIIREEDDSFSFAHPSLQEYFLAGFIVDALSAKKLGPQELAMKRPSNETLDFVADMLTLDERNTGHVIKTLTTILKTTYHKGVSELAFALWQRLHERNMMQPSPETVHLECADLTGWNIKGLNLENAFFDNAVLRGVRFEDTSLVNASFINSCLINAEFISCTMRGANFSKANAAGSSWRKDHMEHSIWRTARLRLASFIACDISGNIGLMKNSETTAAFCKDIGNTLLPDTFYLDTYTGHSGYVTSCAISPDSKRFVSGSGDNTLKLWDIETGICLTTLRGHLDSVYSCAISPDNKRVVSGSGDMALKVWDIEKGDCLMTLEGHLDSVYSCAISPDNKLIVSGSRDNTLKVWDQESGACLRTLRGHIGWVSSCMISPDNKRVVSASGGENNIKVWDIETGTCLRTLKGHSSLVRSCAISSNNKYVVSGSRDKTLKVWDFESGKCLMTFEGHSGWVYSCAISSNNKYIVSGSGDSTLRVWDIETGTCLQTLTGHSDVVRSCVISPDNKYVVSGSRDSTLRVWDMKSSDSLITLKGHSSLVNSCAISSNNEHIVSGSGDSTLKVWNVESGACLTVLEGHLDSVYSCAISPDNRHIVSGSVDKTLKVWNMKSGTCLRTLKGHSGSVYSCAISSNNEHIVSGSEDKTLKVWGLGKGNCLKTLTGHSEVVRSCVISPDNKYILSGSDDKTLKVWDIDSGNCLLSIGHSSPVTSLAISPNDKRVVSGSLDSTLKVWDMESGMCLRTLKGHSGSVYSCAISPDKKRVVSGSLDSTLKVWEMESGECLMTLTGHSSLVSSCIISSDNKLVISGSGDTSLKVWSLESGACTMTMMNLPQNETVSWTEHDERQRLLSHSTGAWRWTGISSGIKRLPIELLTGKVAG